MSHLIKILLRAPIKIIAQFVGGAIGGGVIYDLVSNLIK